MRLWEPQPQPQPRLFFSTTAYILINFNSRKSLFHLFWSSNCNYVIATYFFLWSCKREFMVKFISLVSRIKKISPKTNCPLSPGGTSPSPVRKRGQERCICTYNRGKLPRPRCEKGGTAGETYPSPVSKTVYFTYTRGNFPASYLKNGAKTVYCTYLGAKYCTYSGRNIAPTSV